MLPYKLGLWSSVSLRCMMNILESIDLYKISNNMQKVLVFVKRCYGKAHQTAMGH